LSVKKPPTPMVVGGETLSSFESGKTMAATPARPVPIVGLEMGIGAAMKSRPLLSLAASEPGFAGGRVGGEGAIVPEVAAGEGVPDDLIRIVDLARVAFLRLLGPVCRPDEVPMLAVPRGIQDVSKDRFALEAEPAAPDEHLEARLWIRLFGVKENIGQFRVQEHTVVGLGALDVDQAQLGFLPGPGVG